MSDYREELRRQCEIERGDGPVTRAVKAMLAPDDLAGELVYLFGQEDQRVADLPNASYPASSLSDGLCHCGGYARGDHNFDRTICACGAMHYFCNVCGCQGDPCVSSQEKGLE